MTACDSKYYLSYLNKLVDENNNSYDISLAKKPVDADYSAFTEEIQKHSKAPNLKLGRESGLLGTRIFLAKVALKIGQEKYLLLILC